MKFKKSEHLYESGQNLEKFCHAQNLSSKSHLYALDSALPDIFFELASKSSHSALFTGKNYYNKGFLGYPLLEEIAQNPLISAGVETLADEITRNFIQLNYTMQNDKDCNEQDHTSIEKNTISQTNSKDTLDRRKRFNQLEIDLKRFEIQDLFRQAFEKIGYYGGALLYIDNGTKEDLLHTPLILDKTTFRKNSLRAFKLIDPINCSPGAYNSINPLNKNYFNPSSWFIGGKEIHASRLLYFSAKSAPLLYKPAYNFFGIPLAQMAFEYVMQFMNSKEAAARLLTKFSLTALKTNMAGALAGEGTHSLEARLGYFVEKQNNNGIFALDKEQEDLVKLDTSLSGTTEIVRQSLEIIATVFRIPAVKFLGISPNGFNATGQSDIQNFYDYCASLQEKHFTKNLRKIIEILQINSFSTIDPHIDFEWIELGEKDKKSKMERQKIKSEILISLLQNSIISQEEVRNILLEDKEESLIK